MRLFMSLRRTHSPAVAGAKAGFSTSAAYRFEKDPRLPTQKKSPRERRRADPFADVWENDVLPMLKAAPGLRPISVFEELCRRHPELGSGCRRHSSSNTEIGRKPGAAFSIGRTSFSQTSANGSARRRSRGDFFWVGSRGSFSNR